MHRHKAIGLKNVIVSNAASIHISSYIWQLLHSKSQSSLLSLCSFKQNNKTFCLKRNNFFLFIFFSFWTKQISQFCRKIRLYLFKQVIMQSLGHEATEEEITQMISEVDIDGKGNTLATSVKVADSEWTIAFSLRVGRRATFPEWTMQFRHHARADFFLAGNGTVDFDEFLMVMSKKTNGDGGNDITEAFRFFFVPKKIWGFFSRIFLCATCRYIHATSRFQDLWQGWERVPWCCRIKGSDAKHWRKYDKRRGASPGLRRAVQPTGRSGLEGAKPRDGGSSRTTTKMKTTMIRT